MRFLGDWCCDPPLARSSALRWPQCLDATESLRDATDEQLLARAYAEKRILVTEDKDLGELVHPLRRAMHMGPDRESYPAILPQLAGSAYLTRFHQFV